MGKWTGSQAGDRDNNKRNGVKLESSMFEVEGFEEVQLLEIKKTPDVTIRVGSWR